MEKQLSQEDLTMKHFPYLALLAVILVSACGGIPFVQPTSTPLPTDTPQPTATPLPTKTPTLIPTATRNATATAAANATQASSNILSHLDKVLGDDTKIPYKEGYLVWEQTNPLTIDMSGPNGQILGIDKDLTAKNFILKFDVTWKATGILICGAIFRSEPDLEVGKQYQFVFMRFSGLPAWELEVFEFGKFSNTPTKTKYSDALDLSNGATNEFLLAVQDERFTLYINGQRQGTYYDWSKQRSDGNFGFIGWEQSGEGSCRFKNSWVWSLE
jgi:hypothetical protein